MQTNFKNGTVDSKDVETGTILLCAAAPTAYEPQMATTSGHMKDKYEGKLRDFKLNRRTLRKTPTLWTIGVFPLPSNEYRKARTVFDINGVDEATIAARLFLSMKTRNICAAYKGSTATCKTSSYMKFTVRLLRDPEDDDNIFVDVRRRAGCAMSFRDEHQAIKHAVRYGECPLPVDRRVMTGSFANKDFMEGKYIPLGKDVIEQSLRASVKDLESKYYEARELAVQDLNSTTDPASKGTSPKACKLILEKFPKILKYIMNDVKKRVDYDDVNDDDSDEYLRSLTLNLLFNIISSDPKNETLISTVYNDSIIDHLVWYVSEALTCPWNACLAAKCLGQLKDISSKDGRVFEALEKAEKVGENIHHLLEQEAKGAISEISGCK